VIYLALLALGGLDAAGYSVIAPVVPAIADETGSGPGVMGALVATFAVGQLLGYPLAGYLLQRRHAAWVLGAALALMVVGDLGFVLGGDLGAYFPARLVQGMGAGGLWIGVSFAVIERYPGQEYRRLTGIFAAYSIGSVVGPALGAIGGIRGPFLAHLALVVAAAIVVARIPVPAERAIVASDRAALRTRGFWLASAAILLVALSLGTIEGPLPLHFDVLLDQGEIGALYVATALTIGIAAVLAGRVAPRTALAWCVATLVVGVGLAGLTESVPWWIVACAVAGVGIGLGESGALGVLLEAIGTERIVTAMVVWSQLWALGYLLGPAAAGGVAESLGFGAIGLVPVGAALLVGLAWARAPASRAAVASET
jgi:MFS family permease